MKSKTKLSNHAASRPKKALWLLSLLLGAFVFCGNGHSAWSQQQWMLPSWAQREQGMPFVEISPKYRLQRSWLVAGTVTSVVQTQEEAVVTVEIDHVYAGPAALGGLRFDAHFFKDDGHAPSFNLNYLNAFAPKKRLILSVGWPNSVYLDANPTGGSLDYKRSYGFPLPTIMDGGSQARAVETHAQAVEAVFKAPLEERQQLMESYARADLPLTTIWATKSIARAGSFKGEEFLKQLSQEKNRSIPQLSTIDQELGRGLSFREWIGSTERLNLLMRFGTTPQSEDGGEQGLSALLSAADYVNIGEVTASRFLSAWRAYVENPTVSEKWKIEAIGRVNFLIDARSLPEAEGLAFWNSLVQESRDPEVVKACAQELLKKKHAPQ